MRTKGHNQNKFVRIITLPIRVFGKARDLYVKSLVNCTTRVGRHGRSLALPTDSQFSALPRSFSATSTARSDGSDDYRELIRAASVRGLGHKNEMEMYVHMQQMMRKSSKVASHQKLPKSTSVGMGFMGRIDEDSPCDFEEVGPNKGKACPRSRSYAVPNPSVGFRTLKNN